jgi:hypothetical protein
LKARKGFIQLLILVKIKDLSFFLARKVATCHVELAVLWRLWLQALAGKEMGIIREGVNRILLINSTV